MNEIEKYEFDRMGYLVIKNLLKEEQVKNLLFSINLLERHAIQNLKNHHVKQALGVLNIILTKKGLSCSG